MDGPAFEEESHALSTARTELEELTDAGIAAQRSLRPGSLSQEILNPGAALHLGTVRRRNFAIGLEGVSAEELGPLAGEEPRGVEEIEAGHGGAHKDGGAVGSRGWAERGRALHFADVRLDLAVIVDRLVALGGRGRGGRGLAGGFCHSLPYLMLAGLTVPIFLAIVPLFFVLRGVGLLNTLPGLILTYAAFAFPFTVFFLYAFFRSLSKSIAEAAAVDGAGEWRTFFQIMLPMAKPGLATVAILNFVGLWNQFLLPIALNTNPDNYVLTQAMASFASQAGYSVDFGALFAAVVITVVPVLIIYLIFQRQLQGSVSAGTNK